MNLRIVYPIVAALIAAATARADDVAVAGRKLLGAQQDAVVTVKLVVNLSMSLGSRDQTGETKTEAPGTVIDPNGLTVMSLSAIDPSASMRSVMARRGGSAGDLKIISEVKDAKLVLADGTELAAEVVLRDKDLDLAFVRPTEKPGKPLVAVSLSHAAKPQVLDEVLCLTRLGKIANRVVAVSVERIDAIVDRPRPFYVLAVGGASGVGSPVFAQGGELIGIVLMRNVPTEADGNAASVFSGTGGLGIMPIIVPAADIVEDAKQAAETKTPAGGEEK